MSTMKEISKLAGVSYGTVSNVLNKRGNVSLEKIKLVTEVADKLGYYRNERAGALRLNKRDEIALIIPDIGQSLLCNVYNLLLKKAALLGLKLNLYITDFNSDVEKEQFKLAMVTNKFVVIYTCLTNPESFYDSVSFGETILIFINAHIKMNKSNIFSINYNLQQFANDVSAYIEKKDYKSVLFFMDKKINEEIFGSTSDYVVSAPPFNLPSAIEAISKKDFDLIIVENIEKYESVISARKILQKKNKTDLVIISDRWWRNYHITNEEYLLNLNLLIEQIILIIVGKATDHCIILPYDGFFTLKKQNDGSQFINILMVESPETSALMKIKPFIEQQLGFKINIDIIKYNQYETFKANEMMAKYDLARIDMANLGEIAERNFKPLDNKFVVFLDRFIDHLSDYTHHNGVFYSLPFDISCMVMMYRKDILGNQLIQRAYYEQTKNAEIIPKTFADYSNLEAFFASNYCEVFKPSTVCTGSRLTTGNEFIIRADTKYLLNEEGELDLSNPKVQEALKSYLLSVSFSSQKQNNFWDDVIKEYSGGNTAMSIIYSNYIHMLKAFDEEIFYKTSYTFPPSKNTLIGGGVIGLSKYTNKDNLCYQFLEILYDERIGKLLTHLGGTMPLKAIYSDINFCFVYPWLELIPKALKNHARMHYDNTDKQLSTIEYEKKIGKLIKQKIEAL